MTLRTPDEVIRAVVADGQVRRYSATVRAAQALAPAMSAAALDTALKRAVRKGVVVRYAEGYGAPPKTVSPSGWEQWTPQQRLDALVAHLPASGAPLGVVAVMLDVGRWTLRALAESPSGRLRIASRWATMPEHVRWSAVQGRRPRGGRTRLYFPGPGSHAQ